MKNKQIFIFIFFIGVITTYHIFGYIGHYGYDDLHYAKLAHGVKNGFFDYNDHFTFRTPIILLTALSYSIFGTSDFASSLPTIVITLLILLIVYQSLKDKNNRTLILGLALTTLSNWFIFYSDKLMSDMYVVLGVMATLFVLHQYRYKKNKAKEIWYSLGFVLSLLFGFMSKGTIILLFPLLFYFFALDIYQKKHKKFWIYSIIFGISMLVVYFIAIKILTGDFFKRFDAITNNSYLNLCSYNQQPLAILLKRIGYQFYELLIYQGLATGFIFVLGYIFDKKTLKFFKLQDSFAFWTTSSIILLLSSNFMTISLNSYSPMCLDPRHYLFLVPVVSIPAAIIINDFCEIKTRNIFVIIFAGIIATISLFLQNGNEKYGYIGVFLLLLGYKFVKKSKLNKNIFTVLFVIALTTSPFFMIRYAQNVKYNQQKKIFSEQILSRQDTILVITNEVQKRLGNYYNDFDTSKNVKFVSYKDFRFDSTDCRKKILFLNSYSRYLSGMDFHDLPYFAKNPSKNNKLLYENKKLDIKIHSITDFSNPKQTGVLLFNSLNDFEKNPVNHWHQNSEHITKTIHYEGLASNKLQEFSSTFELSTDSLDLQNFEQLTISSSLYCNFLDKTKATLIISVVSADETYVWDGIEINKYIKAYSNWWKIEHEITLQKQDLKANSKIKIYLWNVDKQKGYIDNFEIKIFGE